MNKKKRDPVRSRVNDKPYSIAYRAKNNIQRAP